MTHWLAPRVSERAVLDFEAAYGIQLPEGYRQFLLHVGNGGDGPPCYGLRPLPTPDVFGDWPKLPDIHKPFPFTRQWIWDQGQTSDEGTYEQIHFGSIDIGDDGCGWHWHLIVTGPERGNVWMIGGEGIQPACPKRDFLTWYEDWLDGKDSFYGFPDAQVS